LLTGLLVSATLSALSTTLAALLAALILLIHGESPWLISRRQG
jgi:hypothetical protein